MSVLIEIFLFQGPSTVSGNMILSNHQDTANNLFDKTKDAIEKNDTNATAQGAIASGPNND